MSPSGKDLYAGTALFLTCYYVLSVNPAILQGAEMPVSIALLGTFLAIILGNLSGVFFTGSGLIIAPAIGISAFFATYVGNTDLVWQQGLFACAIAGLLLAGTSFFTDLRSRIVEELPFSVKLGAKGAIGSLLVASGIKLMAGEIGPNLPEKTVTLVGVGCVTILFLGMVIRNNILERTEGETAPWLGILLHLEYVIALAFALIVLHTQASGYLLSMSNAVVLEWPWSGANLDQLFPANFTQWMLCIPMIIIVWFVVITDIPGTPNVVLPKSEIAANEKRLVENGYRNDGVFAFLSPVFGATPTIYYAENLILRESRRFSPLVGLTFVFWFVLALALVMYFGKYPDLGWSLERVMPPLAVAPVLIFVGAYVTLTSLLPQKLTPEALPADARDWKAAKAYIPAVVGIVATPIAGLEVGFPLSVVSVVLAGVNPREAKTSFLFVWLVSMLLLVVHGLKWLFG